jgi:hypothetical protein
MSWFVSFLVWRRTPLFTKINYRDDIMGALFSTNELPQIGSSAIDPTTLPLIGVGSVNTADQNLTASQCREHHKSLFESQPSSSSQPFVVPNNSVTDASDVKSSQYPSLEEIWDIVHELLDHRSAFILTSFLHEYFQGSNTVITEFRATILPYFDITGSCVTEVYSPMLEWREGSTKVLGFVRIPEVDMEPCGYLMHFSRRCSNTGKRQSSLQWRVHQLDYLTGLFRHAQLVDGILSWTKEDLLNFCTSARHGPPFNDEYLFCPMGLTIVSRI